MEGKEPHVLQGHSLARIRDGKVCYLCDSYTPETEAEATDWIARNGVDIDPSYT